MFSLLAQEEYTHLKRKFDFNIFLLASNLIMYAFIEISNILSFLVISEIKYNGIKFIPELDLFAGLSPLEIEIICDWINNYSLNVLPFFPSLIKYWNLQQLIIENNVRSGKRKKRIDQLLRETQIPIILLGYSYLEMGSEKDREKDIINCSCGYQNQSETPSKIQIEWIIMSEQKLPLLFLQYFEKQLSWHHVSYYNSHLDLPTLFPDSICWEEFNNSPD